MLQHLSIYFFWHLASRKRKKGGLLLEPDEKEEEKAQQNEEEEEEEEVDNIEQVERKREEEEKKKEDALWASFLSDVGQKPKAVAATQVTQGKKVTGAWAFTQGAWEGPEALEHMALVLAGTKRQPELGRGWVHPCPICFVSPEPHRGANQAPGVFPTGEVCDLALGAACQHLGVSHGALLASLPGPGFSL